MKASLRIKSAAGAVGRIGVFALAALAAMPWARLTAAPATTQVAAITRSYTKSNSTVFDVIHQPRTYNV
jgi:hypothetical protein